jgi:hypothetical protein
MEIGSVLEVETVDELTFFTPAFAQILHGVNDEIHTFGSNYFGTIEEFGLFICSDQFLGEIWQLNRV